jgi:hypothetical protein
MKFETNLKIIHKSHRSINLHKFTKKDNDNNYDNYKLIKYCKPCKPYYKLNNFDIQNQIKINNLSNIYLFFDINYDKDANYVFLRYLIMNPLFLNLTDSNIDSNIKLLPNLEIDNDFIILSTKTITIDDNTKLNIYIVDKLYNLNIYKYKLETIIIDISTDSSNKIKNFMKEFFNLNKLYYIPTFTMTTFKQIILPTEIIDLNDEFKSDELNSMLNNLKL